MDQWMDQSTDQMNGPINGPMDQTDKYVVRISRCFRLTHVTCDPLLPGSISTVILDPHYQYPVSSSFLPPFDENVRKFDCRVYSFVPWKRLLRRGRNRWCTPRSKTARVPFSGVDPCRRLGPSIYITSHDTFSLNLRLDRGNYVLFHWL